MEAKANIWCDKDDHYLFENFVDFNAWLDSDDGTALREEYKINGVSRPSKAFYAGDKEAYKEVFNIYHTGARNDGLSKTYLRGQFENSHWFDLNLSRFDQLMKKLKVRDVVPFVGAGLSQAGGFPTWKEHLRQQGRTANLDEAHVEELLAKGKYELIIEEIEIVRGQDVFAGGVRDAFSMTGKMLETTLLITELFTDVVITTNYDQLIEQTFDTSDEDEFQVITNVDPLEKPHPDKVSIIKLHGDINTPAKCIISKNQYDNAYGNNGLDLNLPIPKLIEYYYTNTNLLFLGCSLNNDRTVQVFQAIKEEIVNTDISLPQHFSIEQAPEEIDKLADRNAYLERLGIAAIWFEKGCFDYVERVLELARNELRYDGLLPNSKSPL